MIIVMMGPCGCGKTTIGSALAARLGGDFVEGDDFHPDANRAKMRSGTPLNDTDRWPWLDRIAAELNRRQAAAGTVVLACSALKRAYRDRLRHADPEIMFVLLNGSRDLLLSRLAARKDHFMPPALLDSQLEALELPKPDERALALDVARAPGEMIEQILTHAAAARF